MAKSKFIYPLAAVWLQTLVLAASVQAQNVSFIARRDFGAGSTPLSVAVGDFNGDGFQDLAVANAGSNSVSVVLDNGDGTFQTAVNFGAGTFPGSVAVGDFNGDGIQDLAVTSIQVSVLINNTR
jgi:FG-GAP-like repeat